MSLPIEKNAFHFIVNIPIINEKKECIIQFDYTKLSFEIEKIKIDNIFGSEMKDINFYHLIARTKKEIKQKEIFALYFYCDNIKYCSDYLTIEANLKSKFFFSINFRKQSSFWNSYIPIKYFKLNKYQEFKIYFDYLENKKINKENLINNIISNLESEKDEIQFELIISLVRECFTKKKFQQIIQILNIKQISFENSNLINPIFYENIIDGLTIKFRDKFNNLFNKNTKDLQNGLDKLGLIFYNFYQPNKFFEFFEKSENKND